MKQKVIICKGLPSSGKTTWAEAFVTKNWNYVRVNRDTLRSLLGREFSKPLENIVKTARDTLIREALVSHFNVVVDDTNLDPSVVKHLLEVVASVDPSIEIEIKYFNVELEECLRRNERRVNKVPAKVIVDMWERYLKPQSSHPSYYPHKEGLPLVVVCDLDGTLALKGDRNIYDYQKVGLDIPHKPVSSFLNFLANEGSVDFIFCSGRKRECRGETIKWIKDHIHCSHFLLFMRENEDNRKDAIVKVELWERYIKDKYNIWFWLDDRQQVVDALRKVGIPVWQVAPGDF